MAEVAVPRHLFAGIFRLIAELRPPHVQRNLKQTLDAPVGCVHAARNAAPELQAHPTALV
jgi:hypothetical protein